MNRTPLIAGNWKMHGARGEAVALASALAKSVGRVRGREVVIAPPFTALEAVRPLIAGTDIHLAGQNVHWEPKGAYTGEIAVAMLREAGCTHVIVGHSERRQHFGESNESVNRRLHACLVGDASGPHSAPAESQNSLQNSLELPGETRLTVQGG